MSNDKTEAAFLALTRAHTRAKGAVEAALKSEKLPGLDVFDALRALTQSGEALTARVLETTLRQPQYAVSRLLDRMEKEDLVRRVAVTQDRRSKRIDLTETGRATYVAMAKLRENALQHFFAPRAKPGQLDRMTDLLSLLDVDAERAD